MSAKGKQVVNPPQMTTKFVGSYAIDWLPENASQPGPSSQATSQATTAGSSQTVTSALTSLQSSQTMSERDSDDEELEDNEEVTSRWPNISRDELIEEAQRWIHNKLRRLDRKSDDSQESYDPISTALKKAVASEKKKSYLALLAITLDPHCTKFASTFEEMHCYDTLEAYLELKMIYLLGFAKTVCDVWCGKKSERLDDTEDEYDTMDEYDIEDDTEEDDDDVGDDKPRRAKRQKREKGKKKLDVGAGSRKTSRSANKDKAAQRTVLGWYNGCCVLTHGEMAQGAHILAVAVKGNLRIKEFSAALHVFWPGGMVERCRKQLLADGHEYKNILPLRIDAHSGWDRKHFALRPIEHLTEPTKKMYIQMVWLPDFDRRKGLVTDNRDHRRLGTIVDFRRKERNFYEGIETGDVYEIATTDPDAYPLPSFDLLHLQYALHRVFSCIKAAGSLKTIFKGDPPNVDPVPGDTTTVPSEWRDLLESAKEARILSEDARAKWARAFTLLARKRKTERRKRMRETLEELEELEEQRSWRSRGE